MTRCFALGSLMGLMMVTAPVMARDARLISHMYAKDDIVRVDAQLGVQAVIAFGEDEQIENVAIGDSTNWQITPNKRANLLFVKPLTARGRTNLTVVTDRRTYFLDLVSNPALAPVYQLRFTYPDAPKKPAAASAPLLTPEESELASGSPLARPVDPADMNFAWKKTGAPSLLPSKVYDDGKFVYLVWPAASEMPAILVRDAKGAEGPVNYAVRDDLIVVDGVPALLILRSGRNVASLEYQGVPKAIESAAPAANKVGD
jgi:type IV secretion system protein VirB9